jgi:hypothetical protein
MRENGIVVVGEAVYILCNLVEAESAAAEREACALVCLMPVDEIQVTDDCSEYVYKDHLDCAEAIRARALHDMNQAAEKNGEEL